ncbi:hypothetical protein [Streptomyces sp. NPDC048002]|uniref:hypothetical protein n=1 Tax=Streptomyces sp. NPDC048002 TaxID=3154344 RepID=UPI0033DB6606
MAGRLEFADEGLTGGADYIEHTAWRVNDKVLLVGVKHDGTETPVQLVVVLRAFSADLGSGDDGEWL